MDQLHTLNEQDLALDGKHCMICLPSIENKDGKPVSLSSSWNGWGSKRPTRPLSAFPNGFYKMKTKKPLSLPKNTSECRDEVPKRPKTPSRRMGSIRRSMSVPNGLLCNEVERTENGPLSPLHSISGPKFMVGDLSEVHSENRDSTVTARMILKVQANRYVEEINKRVDHFCRKGEGDRSIRCPEATLNNTYQGMNYLMNETTAKTYTSASRLVAQPTRPVRTSCPSLGTEKEMSSFKDDAPKMRRRKLSEVCPPTDLVLPEGPTVHSLSDLKDGLPSSNDQLQSHDVLVNRIEDWLEGVERSGETDGEEDNLASEVSLMTL